MAYFQVLWLLVLGRVASKNLGHPEAFLAEVNQTQMAISDNLLTMDVIPY